MTAWRSALVVLGLLLALVAVNRAIVGHERLLADGTRVLLPMSSFDTRAMMRGDALVVTYDDADAIQRALLRMALPDADTATLLRRMSLRTHAHADGYAVFRIDGRDVGRFVRVQPAPMPRRAHEIALRVRLRGGGVKIPGDVWYFSEDQSAHYAAARYGELRVDDDGTALLTGLYDRDRKPL